MIRRSSAIAAVAMACAFIAPAAPAQVYTLKQDAPSLGTNIRRDVVRAPLPPEKSWEELTSEQQDLVKAQYEQIAPGDEPPFPRHGLAPIYKALAAIQARLGVPGELTLAVDVASDGKPVAVSAFQSPDPQLTKAAATVLMLQDFKPARCGGQACRMQFPLRMKLTRSL